MKLFYSPAFAASRFHFDTTRKAEWIVNSFGARAVQGVQIVAPAALTDSEIERVHAPAYVAAVRTGEPRALAESSGLDWDPGIWPMVLASNGGAVAAALQALVDGVAGSLSSGLHHAYREHGSGYCTFNGLVLAAWAARRAGARRIFILDLDSHFGGGTHSLIAGTLNLCQTDIAVSDYDSYEPAGRNTLDRIVRAEDYIPTLRARLAERELDGPFDLCLYNAGMDPFEGCMEGGLSGISREILREREQIVFEWIARLCIPTAFVLAGGYTGPRLSRDGLVDLHRLTIEAAATTWTRLQNHQDT